MNDSTFPTNIVSASRSELGMKVQFVLDQLDCEAAFYGPKHVAPILGITPNAFTKHLRKMEKLRTWKYGSWCFLRDDLGHMRYLREAITIVLQKGQKLPTALRS